MRFTKWFSCRPCNGIKDFVASIRLPSWAPTLAESHVYQTTGDSGQQCNGLCSRSSWLAERESFSWNRWESSASGTDGGLTWSVDGAGGGCSRRAPGWQLGWRGWPSAGAAPSFLWYPWKPPSSRPSWCRPPPPFFTHGQPRSAPPTPPQSTASSQKRDEWVRNVVQVCLPHHLLHSARPLKSSFEACCRGHCRADLTLNANGTGPRGQPR